jgi:hypothetical protein
MYVRKSQRACNAVNDPRFAQAARIACLAFNGPQFEEEADGQRIRIWADGNVDWVTADDVRAWLLNQRVVDLREGLEFVREDYIKMMVREDFLRIDPSRTFYWVTAKAAERWHLPKVMGCEFPK